MVNMQRTTERLNRFSKGVMCGASDGLGHSRMTLYVIPRGAAGTERTRRKEMWLAKLRQIP